jgi:hypothetical protein
MWWLLAALAAASGDDVDLIPKEVTAAEPAAPEAEKGASFRARWFVEDAPSASTEPREVPVPYPPSQASRWQNRASVDASLSWRPAKPIALTLSGRLNVFAQDGMSILSPDTIRVDLREAYATWQPIRDFFVEAGRVNVREGVALGFNPTDFFKTRTLVDQSSLDPSVIRQNRLGTVMVRAQAIGAGISVSAAVAPKLASPPPLIESDPIGVDPHIGAMNGAWRAEAALGFEVADLSPKVLGYLEAGRSRIGFNASRPIGDAVIAYAEWAGGLEKSLATRAAGFGKQTGTLPQNAPTVPPDSGATSFRNDLAAGFSWTIAATLTLNAEYHFHQGGFTHADWSYWFSHPAEAKQLWFVRGYANDQQEPVSQHQLFARLAWPRFLSPDLEVDGFAFVSLIDGSVLSQLSLSDYLSKDWTLAAFISGNFGAPRSERGSFPHPANLILQITRYF